MTIQATYTIDAYCIHCVSDEICNACLEHSAYKRPLYGLCAAGEVIFEGNNLSGSRSVWSFFVEPE